ncbi:MAG: LptF/LptG family permease [Atribacterota bacterium]|nr:LptF/LptG family permease [Atribacterota bacterium]
MIKESASGMFIWVGAVTIVMLVQVLFELAEFFVNEQVPFLIAVEILLLYIPAQMVMTFPISALLAAELNLGRLSRDSELVAIEASGVSLRRFIWPYIAFSLLVALGSFALNDLVVPETNHRAQVLLREYVYKKTPPRIQQNVFFRDSEDRYFYVNELDNRTWEMRRVIIYEMGRSRSFPNVIVAQKARWLEDQWLLEDGVLSRYNEEGRLEEEVTFTQMTIDMKEELKEFFEKQRSPEEMPFRELRQQIAILKQAGSETQKLEVAYHLKFALPFSALMFILIGMPLGLQRRKDSKTLGVIVTVILAFVYYILLSVFRSLGRGEIMVPWLAAWMPDIIFGVFGFVLYLLVDRK